MRNPPDTFHITFDTQTYPGSVLVTSVKLSLEIVDPAAPGPGYRIDLCDHPQYAALERYVLAHPRKTARQ